MGEAPGKEIAGTEHCTMRYKSRPVHTKYNTQARTKGTGNGEIKLKWSGEGTEYQNKIGV